MATLVRFYKESGSILAYFPGMKYGFNGYRNDLKVCYTHVGQHSCCAPEYVKKLSEVKHLSECQSLINELTRTGYNLRVLNKFKVEQKKLNLIVVTDKSKRPGLVRIVKV